MLPFGSVATALPNAPLPGPGTVTFHVSVVPAATGCSSNNGIFAFSAASVSDAESRRGMLAVLIAAQAQGAPIILVYDDAGRFCDPLGYAVPIALGLAPTS